jgi:hypothetical protein
MSTGIPVRVRSLPQGESGTACQVSRNGRFLELDLSGTEGGFDIGQLVEIEDGPCICLGEILQRNAGTAKVLIEHSIDRSRLPSLEETWG